MRIATMSQDGDLELHGQDSIQATLGIQVAKGVSDTHFPPLRPSRLPRKKEAPLAGRAAAILVIAFQSIAERCSNAAWNGVAKAA